MVKNSLFYLLLFPILAFSQENIEPIQQERHLMGTNFTILVSENHLDDTAIENALQLAFSEIERLDYKYSTYKPDSLLSTINRQSYQTPITIDEETFFLLNFAKQFNLETKGTFDITAETLSKLWNFKQQPFTPPSENLIKQTLSAIGPSTIILSDKQVQLAHPKTQLTFNAFSKGYAVDKAAQVLKENNIDNFIVAGSGDMFVAGNKFGKPWQLGIQHPRKSDNETMGTINLKNKALTTSGDYNNFIEHQGKRYGHILDPRTGYPANVAQSVTVIAPTTMEADALSTAFMVLGKEETARYLQSHPGTEVLFIDQKGQIYGTSFFITQFQGIRPLHN